MNAHKRIPCNILEIVSKGELVMKFEEAIEIFEENFLVMNKEFLEKVEKMSLSEFWRSYNRNVKLNEMMPLAYVRKGGRISFNEAANKFELIEEIREVLTTVWKNDHEEMVVCVTRSAKELAEISPKLKLLGYDGSSVKDMR